MSMNYSFSEKTNIYKTIEILKNGENKYENLSMSIVGMTFADMKSALTYILNHLENGSLQSRWKKMREQFILLYDTVTFVNSKDFGASYYSGDVFKVNCYDIMVAVMKETMKNFPIENIKTLFDIMYIDKDHLSIKSLIKEFDLNGKYPVYSSMQNRTPSKALCKRLNVMKKELIAKGVMVNVII